MRKDGAPAARPQRCSVVAPGQAAHVRRGPNRRPNRRPPGLKLHVDGRSGSTGPKGDESQLSLLAHQDTGVPCPRRQHFREPAVVFI